MIPSRGLRWSSQAIAIGRRRLETVSARQFSSIPNASRSSPLLASKGTTILRTNARFQFSKSNTLIRNGAAIRFASTTPAATGSANEAVASTSEITTSSLDSAMDFSTDSLYDIPEHIGYLHSLGLDYGWGPTSVMQWVVEHIHVYAGTPWWASIAITAITVRALLFVPYVGAAENASRLQSIAHITKPLQAEMTAAYKSGDQLRTQEIRTELGRIQKRAGIVMWKSFVPLLQMFAGYGSFILFRGMGNLPVPGWETGGVLWFENLSLPDPTFMIPIATAGVLHWVLRNGGETGSSTLTPEMQKIFMWGLPAISLAFTWWLPAALQFSFFISGILSYGQASLFKWQPFRRYMNMHSTDPVPSSSNPKPTAYKGEMKVRAPLTSAELDKAYQEGKKAGMLQKAMDPIKKVAQRQFTDKVDAGKEKREKRGRGEFEMRRQQEIREERVEKERLRRNEIMRKKMSRKE